MKKESKEMMVDELVAVALKYGETKTYRQKTTEVVDKYTNNFDAKDLVTFDYKADGIIGTFFGWLFLLWAAAFSCSIISLPFVMVWWVFS